MLAVLLRSLVEVELAKVVRKHGIVLFLEHAGVFAEGVLAVVVAVLGDFVDEEQ